MQSYTHQSKFLFLTSMLRSKLELRSVCWQSGCGGDVCVCVCACVCVFVGKTEEGRDDSCMSKVRYRVVEGAVVYTCVYLKLYLCVVVYQRVCGREREEQQGKTYT